MFSSDKIGLSYGNWGVSCMTATGSFMVLHMKELIGVVNERAAPGFTLAAPLKF